MTEDDLTPVVWMGRSRRDLKDMPVQVRREVGQALYWAKKGTKHPAAKPLRGELSGVMEIVSDHDGETFRAVYTTKLAGVLYVLHAFQKKSTSGIATPKKEIEVIKSRLADARDLHRQRQKGK